MDWSLLHIFVFGTFWFYTLCAGLFVALVFLSEWEKGLWAFFSVAVFFLCLQFLGSADTNILYYIFHHPWTTLGLIACYFAGGVVYAPIKWYLYVHDNKHKLYERMISWLSVNGQENPVMTETGLPEIPANLTDGWLQELRHDRALQRYATMPSFYQLFSTIMLWMTYWPANATWTFLNDPIRRFFRFMTMRMRNIYISIAQRAYAGVPNWNGNGANNPRAAEMPVLRPDAH